MSLSAGVRLGPYEIQQAIGAGGMGEVYRARDTRLDRTVAIKVLPSALAADERFRERFEREARTISQLAHPHICALFDVGEAPVRGAAPGTGSETVRFLVMEYLEGETLSERLARAGALRFDEALTVAIQIAGALDAAHRSGVIHRDLKPGNIMLTKAGAKLLDFGLAKADLVGLDQAQSALKLTTLPTTPVNITLAGTIIGTVQYMAPEQLEGSDADERTDIFAFGCVLFEMMTGRRAFAGKSHASIISAIMSAEPPPISRVQPLSPLALDRVVTTCLAKDPNDRWQSARDVLRELKWITADAGSSPSAGVAVARPVASRRSKATWPVVAVLLVLTTLAAAAIAAYFYVSRPALSSVRFTVAPPDKVEFDLSGRLAGTGANGGTVSPDGRKMAFTGKDASGKVSLWIHSFDSLLAQPLLGTDGADLPFWAPDSRSLGFFAQGKLKRIDVTGGQTLTLADAPLARGGTWNRDGVIVFAPVVSGPLFRVAATGGQPVAVTRTAPGQTAHRYPSFLADQRHFLFRVSRSTGDSPNTFVGSLDSEDVTPLVHADTNVVFAPPGYVLYAVQGTLLAQVLDAGALRLVGEPFPVAENVATSSATGAGAFSASASGVLTFRTGSGGDDLDLTWVDRAGKPLDKIGTASYRGIELSRDGKRIAVHRHEPRGGDIWALDPKGGTPTRITFDASQHNSSPVWSPDAERIAFGAVKEGSFGLYEKPSNGATQDDRLLASTDVVWPTSWSSDGRFIVYTSVDTKDGTDIWMLPLSGDRKAVPFVRTPGSDGWGQISPDAHWIAYSSSESGVMQVYVRPFPSGAGKWQISTTHGNYPRWRGDGKEIFYMTGGQVVAVSVTTNGAAFDAGVPHPLFEARYTNLPHPGTGGGSYHPFSVSPDGQRFLIPILASKPDATVSAPITVVLNWTAGIRR